MSSKFTTRVVWPDQDEIDAAHAKAKRLGYPSFSEFVRAAAAAYKKKRPKARR